MSGDAESNSSAELRVVKNELLGVQDLLLALSDAMESGAIPPTDGKSALRMGASLVGLILCVT
jgi:hypothetical protein